MITRFGAYEILHELSSGGMGAVLLGRRRGPGAFEQLVAIKTIRPEYANSPSVRAMFLDEAAILARINHPGIATVHDFGEEGGTLYMVMEYVAGTSLRALIEGNLPPLIAARAIADACRGVHAAHEVRDTAGHLLGVVHRDISPDNLLLGFDGHIKVIDFGIALVKNRQAPVTEFGTVKGKPPYMSPEQVKNEAMDRRSDVFSLAVVLHELLTGQALFDGDSIFAIARAVELSEIKPPSIVRGEPLPLGLDAVVMNALDRDPSRRTPTAAAFAEDLERVISTAGDETLEAWAERALAEPRTAHRGWLAQVVAGKDAPEPIGRPTGAFTQVGPVSTDTQGAQVTPAAAPAGDDRPGTSTHLPPASADLLDDASLDRPPRRSLALPLLAALLVLLAVGTGAYLSLRHGEAPRDAGVPIADATTVVIVADATPVIPSDAAPVIPSDAAEPAPVDAGPRRVPTDAGRPPVRDAAPVHVPIDAAPVIPAATGTGFVNIRHRSGASYANVVLDGRPIGVTPMLRHKLAAGHHTLELLAPDTNEVVFHQEFDVAADATVSLQPR